MGTTRGASFVYNHQQRRKIPIDSKHTKSITEAEWVNSECFVLASDDKQISLNSVATGQCLSILSFKHPIAEMRCLLQSKNQIKALSICINKKSISLIKILEPRDGNEMSLSTTAHELTTAEGSALFDQHLWLDESTLLASMQTGRCLLISTSEKNSKSRPLVENIFQEEICSISYFPNKLKLAMATKTEIKVLTLCEKSTVISSETIGHDTSELINQVEWTSDGQVLTVSTKSGRVLSFLSELPLLHDVWMNHILYLTSMMQMDIVDFSKDKKTIRFRTNVEPTQCAIGPNHVVVTLQNKAWFYHYSSELLSSPVELGFLKYNSSIEKVLVTESCVFFFSSEKRIIAQHLLEQDLPKNEFYLPVGVESEDEVLCFDANRDFCVTGMQNGSLIFHRNSDFKEFLIHKHCLGILSVKAQPSGVRVIFMDLSRMIFILNPVTNLSSKIQLTDSIQPKIYWDWTDSMCFAICSDSCFHPFMITESCQQMEFAQPLLVQELPRSYTPVSLNNHQIYVQHRNGGLDWLMLRAKECLQAFDCLIKAPDQDSDKEKAKATFFELLQLDRLHDARYLASKLNCRPWLEVLGERCMQNMELTLAIEVFRELKKPAMVQKLVEIENTEERNLVAGELLVLLGTNLDKAQELFLQSSKPVNAVYLLEDLESWEDAEIIARRVSPHHIPQILFKHAMHLEDESKHLKALENYSNALDEFLDMTGKTEDDGFVKCCKAGAARILIQLGQLVEARALFQELDDVKLLQSCAEILETKKLLNEAGSLYEKGGMIKKAITLYIAANNLSKAEPLTQIVSEPDTYKAFAKAKEQLKQYDDALDAYKKSGSSVEVVRVLLECKKAPKEAFQYIRKNYEINACKVVQTYCKEHSFTSEYIEFSMKMKDFKSAFEIAKSLELWLEIKNQMDEDSDKEWWIRLGESIKNLGDFENAGDCYAAAAEADQALDLYMKSGPKTLKKCLEIVRKNEHKDIVQKLLDWALDLDNDVIESTNLLLLFDFQLALGKHEMAIELAIKQAQSEQCLGNYGVAHKILTGLCIRLKKFGIQIPSTLYKHTVLLHSYVLARQYMETESSQTAALLLIRVCKNISAFPAHASGILTSAVITCQRENYRKSAIDLARIAVQPEHRHEVCQFYLA
eukprot:g5844.t1